MPFAVDRTLFGETLVHCECMIANGLIVIFMISSRVETVLRFSSPRRVSSGS